MQINQTQTMYMYETFINIIKQQNNIYNVYQNYKKNTKIQYRVTWISTLIKCPIINNGTCISVEKYSMHIDTYNQ